MIVRAMGIEDLNAVYQIECESFSMPWSKASFKEELSQSYAYYSVVVIDEKLVAYGGIRIILGEAEITNIAVDRHYRGRGIGKIVFSYLIQQAKQKDVRTITLEVRKSNQIAESLYLACGFKHIALRKNYYQEPTEDAAIMQIDLHGQQ